MKNVLFIVTPAGTKLEMTNNKKIEVDNRPVDIVSKIGGSEKLHLIRKTSTSIIDVHYIEKCHINGNVILPVKESGEDTREVLVFTNPKAGEYRLFKTDEDNIRFALGEKCIVFNKVTADAVFL